MDAGEIVDVFVEMVYSSAFFFFFFCGGRLVLDPSLVMTDVFLLSGILEFPFLSPLSFFCLVLLLFLSFFFFFLLTIKSENSPKSLQHFLDFVVWVLLSSLGMTVAMGRG